MTRKTVADAVPAARGATIRRALCEVLREAELSAREISARLSIPERDVAEHLTHVDKSLDPGAERLDIVQPACAACGFTFDVRGRFRRPSRCPRCKSERIHPARYTIRSR